LLLLTGALMPDVVVIGGGVIGCAIAHRLASEGAQVTVIERSRIAAESSGAAAGILAPPVHATAPHLFDLAMASHVMFPALTEQLRAETGLDAEYVRSGAIDLARDETGEELLRDKLRWLQEAGHGVRWLDPEDVLAMEPQVHPNIRGAFYDEDGYQIRPARFNEALAQAAARCGVRFQLNTEVVGFEGARPRLGAVTTATGTIAVGHVILAAGAWASTCGDWLGIHVPVFPARGQILTLYAMPPPIRHILYGAGVYLLPRLDGTIVVGATAERVGFDKSLTASALAWLLSTAPLLVPVLADAAFDRAWAGLRPGSPDDLPIIGTAPGWENVTLAVGHYRNGIMLAPITARLVADLVLRGQRGPLLEHVGPERFQGV
jgi:glycine oxidase